MPARLPRIARLLRIEGRVQGVGYRDWFCCEASRHGVDGWFRNRPDGTVEALISGDGEAVRALAAAARRGPPLARVVAVTYTPSDPPSAPGFHRAPTG